MGKLLFSRDKEPYQYEMTLWDGEEVNGLAEKHLGRNI
jgi:hypothetical protein